MECVIVEKNIFGDFVGSRISDRRHAVAYVNTGKHRRKYYRKCDVIYRYLHIELIWRLLMVQYLQKQCYYEMDYSFYSFYWLDSLVTIIATLGVLWASRRTTGPQDAQRRVAIIVTTRCISKTHASGGKRTLPEGTHSLWGVWNASSSIRWGSRRHGW